VGSLHSLPLFGSISEKTKLSSFTFAVTLLEIRFGIFFYIGLGIHQGVAGLVSN